MFEFVSKFAGLDKKLIDLLFNLLEKGNDAICRSLYSTLQASGRVNLENNQVYLLERIIALPRASCYN